MAASTLKRIALQLAALLAVGAGVGAQEPAPAARPDSILVADSLAPDSARARSARPESLTVASGQRRYATGGVRELLLGKHYRALWNAKLRVEVLNLAREAGGLTPYKEGGNAQTRSLRFRGADSLNYVFRSLEKDPTREWPEDLRNTVAAGIVEDQMSALHPGAALVVAELVKAAGILHTTPRLMWLPDDPRLGQYRARYGRTLGLFEERPAKGDVRIPGLADARKIASTEELFEELEKGPRNQANARQFLAARLVDMLVGDWDRHPSQWVWARFDVGDMRRWEPVPRDRDWALTHLDGIIVGIGRTIDPKYVSFGAGYGSVLGLTISGQALDRRLLSGLSRPVFDSVATALAARITDSVIDAATSQLPAEMYAVNGKELRHDLRARRDGLPQTAGRFYEILSGQVNVYGTNDPEHARVIRTARGVDVELHAGAAKSPWFRRSFDAGETSEVRLYLLGGDDRVEVRGAGPSRPLVRLVTGRGQDRVVDSSSAGGLRVYDVGDRTEVVSIRGIDVDRRPYVEYAVTDTTLIPPRDWGSWWTRAPWISSGPDVGLFVGAAATHYAYGFRSQPYASRVTFRGGYATGASTFRLELDGEFRRPNSRARTNLLLRASGIEIVRFHGYGNETLLSGPDAFYRVPQKQFLAAPSFSVPLVGDLMLRLMPTVEYAQTELDPDRAIWTSRPYGVDGFGQVGARADLTLDTRDSPAAATRGVQLMLGGAVHPGVWDVETTYGDVHGEASTYLTARHMPLRPVLALRGGARKLLGTYPFFEAAFVGGAATVRGLREQRYAGDAAVYGNAELRLALGRVMVFLPTDVGIFALADAGRVFLDGESSTKVHSGFGGGLSLSILSPANTVSLALVRGEDRTGFYLRAGFAY